jgi:hypothetical protein
MAAKELAIKLEGNEATLEWNDSSLSVAGKIMGILSCASRIPDHKPSFVQEMDKPFMFPYGRSFGLKLWKSRSSYFS